LPSSLSTAISPSACLTIDATVGSPSPVPFPSSLVVKYGSNRWDRTWAFMPVPLSRIDRTT